MADKKTKEKETITLRIPAELKENLEQVAQQERRSVNQQVVVILESATKHLREQKAAQQAA